METRSERGFGTQMKAVQIAFGLLFLDLPLGQAEHDVCESRKPRVQHLVVFDLGGPVHRVAAGNQDGHACEYGNGCQSPPQ